MNSPLAPRLELDNLSRHRLPDTLDEIAYALGVVAVTEAQEDAVKYALLIFARLIQRDTLAAVVAPGTIPRAERADVES